MRRSLALSAVLLASLASRAFPLTIYSCEVVARAKGEAVKPVTRQRYLFSPDFESTVLLTGYVMDRALLTLRATADGSLAGSLQDQKTGAVSAVAITPGSNRFDAERFSGSVSCRPAERAAYALRSEDGFFYVPGHEAESFDHPVDRQISTFRHCWIGDGAEAAADLGRRMNVASRLEPSGRVSWTYTTYGWSQWECPPEWDRCRGFGDRVPEENHGSIERCDASR